MLYTVRKGKRYAARIRLSGFEVLATNKDIYSKLAQVGFSDVNVTGSGSERIAHGTWPNEDKTAQLPSEIVEIVIIPETRV